MVELSSIDNNSSSSSRAVLALIPIGTIIVVAVELSEVVALAVIVVMEIEIVVAEMELVSLIAGSAVIVIVDETMKY